MYYHRQLPLLVGFLSPHVIPYIIIIVNFLLFKILRSLVNRLLTQNVSDRRNPKYALATKGKVRIVKLFIDELISTCELCADCAELNVVYQKHGSLAYGASLFLLSYLWIDAFGEAHTTPAYLVEEYFFVKGNQLLRTGDAYARFVGQSMAMPLAWRFASFYWKYHLLEFGCCLICRLLELIGHKLLEKRRFSQRVVSLISSFVCTALVVSALELSGGYFNPILAASLEYGCKGILLYQHAMVFWLGPLLGHLMARALFKRYGESWRQFHVSSSSSIKSNSGRKQVASDSHYARVLATTTKRLTRSHSRGGKKQHTD